MANNNNKSATKVVIPCRISFANIWEPKSINGSDEKYSVSCIIPKSDKATLAKIHKAIEAAKEDGKSRKWGGKIPANLKLPLRDGDVERADDEAYAEAMYVIKHRRERGHWESVEIVRNNQAEPIECTFPEGKKTFISAYADGTILIRPFSSSMDQRIIATVPGIDASVFRWRHLNCDEDLINMLEGYPH